MLGAERMHTFANALAGGLSVLDVAPSSHEVASKIAALRTGYRRPIMVLGSDGAFVPTRLEGARGHHLGRKRQGTISAGRPL